MANHTIDCDFCGKDMRGRVKGCHSQQEADRCCHFDAQAALTALRAERERLDEECRQSMSTIAQERARAETAEARVAELAKALEPFAKCETQSDMETVATERFRRARAALKGASNEA